ncbi:serine hydrolase [Pimelobacter sp. 30-1]|uniref:serine hydrolase domain-containing protein n=1 Tax=Pimelobacter sp. 30-1 TaxID=2004991 RepID=UPI001C04E851|nr:serine hydrolase domain-containing protein [Pimelobacter sp. 30-1]MBU2698881.1 hypothetical protein [Pimelobacter sp. 30-1]
MSVRLPEDLLRGERWAARLAELAEKHAVPGLQVGLLTLDGPDRHTVRVLSHGMTSLRTGVGVDDDTLFQLGSITKVWTATLVMQLVDEGRLTLDTRVVDVLPDFRLADQTAADTITVRHLLTHTSGIDGDILTDTGDGDDALARYVEVLVPAVCTTPPGGHFDYCNAGFAVAGRIVEVLRETDFTTAIQRHLFEPLGLEHTVMNAKDAILHRAAVGHLADLSDPGVRAVTPTPQWSLPRSSGPMGGAVGRMEDLLALAAGHLLDGVGLNGTRFLSAESARLMRALQVDLGGLSSTDAGWGLGWAVGPWGPYDAVNHGGATIGQIAQLHVLPSLGLAVGVLTNSRGGTALAKEVLAEIGRELGLEYPMPRREPGDHAPALALAAAGTYESATTRLALERDGEQVLRLRVEQKENLTGEPDAAPTTVEALADDRFLQTADQIEFAHTTYRGEEYLFALRLFKKVTS